MNWCGCVVDPVSSWYADGYNHVSEARLRALYRKDVFRECQAEAEATVPEQLQQPGPGKANREDHSD
jgi:hypothetical protein